MIFQTIMPYHSCPKFISELQIGIKVLLNFLDLFPKLIQNIILQLHSLSSSIKYVLMYSCFHNVKDLISSLKKYFIFNTALVKDSSAYLE